MSSSFVSRRDVVVGAAAALTPAAARTAPVPQVAMLGDSITAGWGLPQHDALPWRLQAELAELGVPVRIMPAGVIGETTAGGLARVDQAVPAGVELCIVALGGNDFLQATDPAAIEVNLEQIVWRLRTRDITVVLAGVQVPPMLRSEYGHAFNGAFAAAASRHEVIFLPDLLEGVTLNPELNQSDGVHPNAAGVSLIARRLAPLVAQGLKSVSLAA
jgi:acyl-CoA thioesterase-1